MVGLDTNVVVRLLTRDDPEQLGKAEAAIRNRCSEADPARIDPIVLVETVWVLARLYDYSRAEIVHAVERILQVRELAVGPADAIWEALHLYRDGAADFADYVLAVFNRGAGCSATLTFDKKAAKSTLFEGL